MPAYLGQHFLIDVGIAAAAVDALDLHPEDVVVEIGPGRGILTGQVLQAKPKKLVAVELDQDLIGGLRKEYADLEIVHSDFLKFDLDSLEQKKLKFIGNLPYAVASPILQKVLEWDGFELGVFMFQKEVCDRLIAAPGSRDYGVLSIVAQLRSEVSWVAEAGRDRFRPRPSVDSGVLKFRARKTVLPKGVTEKRLLSVVKTAFSQRRKQIANPLSQGLSLPKEQVIKALEMCGIAPTARAEEVPVAAFAALTLELLPPTPKKKA